MLGAHGVCCDGIHNAAVVGARLSLPGLCGASSAFLLPGLILGLIAVRTLIHQLVIASPLLLDLGLAEPEIVLLPYEALGRLLLCLLSFGGGEALALLAIKCFLTW